MIAVFHPSKRKVRFITIIIIASKRCFYYKGVMHEKEAVFPTGALDLHSNEIRYFMAVALTGSLSAASQQLFVAVSAISRQIQRLEARIGVPLFDRHARGMILNDAGHILENHIRKSRLDMAHAFAEIQGLKAVRRTLLRIACTDGLACDLLPSLLSRFRTENPGVTFSLTVAGSAEISAGLRNGECDVALLFSLSPERNVDVAASLPAPVLLLMHADHPLARREISLSDLSPFPLALPDQSTTVRQLFDLACRMEGTLLEPALTCNNFSTLYQFMLDTPQAVTITSQYSVLYRAQVEPVRLKAVMVEQMNQRTLQILTQAGKRQTMAQRMLVAFIIEQLKQQVACLPPIGQA